MLVHTARVKIQLIVANVRPRGDSVDVDERRASVLQSSQVKSSVDEALDWSTETHSSSSAPRPRTPIWIALEVLKTGVSECTHRPSISRRGPRPLMSIEPCRNRLVLLQMVRADTSHSRRPAELTTINRPLLVNQMT